MKVFMAVLTIVGMVIGSGFISGKEIVVFFSRFGAISFIGVAIAFFLFFYLFKFLFNFGDRAIEKLKTSRFALIVNICICFVFTSSMFAGVVDSLSFLPSIYQMLLFFFILFLCLCIIKKGVGSLEKLNLLFVPFMILFLLVFLGLKIDNNFISYQFENKNYFSILYSVLYVFMNISNTAVVFAYMGKTFSKKQKTRVAFFSALVLFVVLLFANIVLLQNPDVFDQNMPLIALYSGVGKTLFSIVILFGCLTTLFSLIFTTSSSLRGVCDNIFFLILVSEFLPLLFSFFGFSFIVTYLYPLVSLLGIFLFCYLFFIPFFKRAHKKIHSTRKQT